MINITLPDGSTRKVESGTTAHDIALEISEGLARNVLAAEVNGEVRDPQRPIEIHSDATLKLLTWNDDAGQAHHVATAQRTCWRRRWKRFTPE